MSLATLFRMTYWSIRKDWRVLPHLAAVLHGWLTNLVRLRVRGLSRPGTIAIGLVEHLGDIVAAEPVSRFARLRHPDAKIVWFARAPYASVPAGFAEVDAVVSVTCLTEWLLLRASGIGDPAWDLHINQRYCPRCQIPVLKTGSAAAIDPETYYRAGNLLAVECLSAGIPVLTEGPILPVDEAASSEVDRLDLPAHFVAIHCASNESSRDWPRARWVELVAHILDDPGVSVLEIGTLAVVLTRDANRRRNLCGTLSIQQTAEVIRRAALFIGIDSGPAHIANAVGAPGVILLANYKAFADYMPYSGRYQNGEGADIVRTSGPMDALPVAPVLAAVRRRLGNA
ncbi:MAG: glycosyltransferase family 9 protein [Rhodopila sp.]